MTVVGKNGQTYDEAKVVQLLQTNQTFLERALLELFQRQTEDERSYGDVIHRNYRGFSASHASVLTRYAKWLASGRHLTGTHLEKAKEILPRYRRQILDIIAEKNQNK